MMALTDLLTEPQVADLGRSGLNKETIRTLGIRPAGEVELEACGVKLGPLAIEKGHLPYIIPYFTLEGAPTSFYRMKLLHEGAQKYKQPSSSTNWIYFPKGFRELAEKKSFILITEGEKKAAASIQAGYPCIGIGGVDSWRSRTFKMRVSAIKHDAYSDDKNELVVKLAAGSPGVRELEGGVAKGLPELADFVQLESKTILIVFDTDLLEAPFLKGEIQRAAADLAHYFRTSDIPTAKIRMLVLPPQNGQKTGLDDYILQQGPGGLSELINQALDAGAAKLYPRRPNLKVWVTKQLNSGRLTRDGIEKISLSILTELDASGTRLRAPDNRFYYFDSDRKVVLPAAYVGPVEKFVADASFGQYLYTRCGLRTRDDRVKVGLLDAFTAEEPLEHVQPHRGFHVLEDGSGLDVQISDNHLLRVTAKGIRVEDNGSGGTLFLSEQVKPLDLSQSDVDLFVAEEAVDKGRIPYWYTVLSNLSIEPQPQLSVDETAQIVAALFYISPWLNRWRGTQLPLEIACAEAGSGKSSLYTLRLSVITGKPELQNVPQDLRDWYAAIAESPGIWVGDNVRFTGKDMRQRLSDELCRLTTEPIPYITLRKLYTTAERARIPVNTVFAMTSIYPPFSSADLRQRSFAIQFKAIPEGERISNWVTTQLEHFGGRKGWLLHHLLALRNFFRLTEREWDPAYKAYHRLANFEQCLLLMSKVLGLELVTKECLLRMAHSASGIADDTTMEGLIEFGRLQKEGVHFPASTIAEWADGTDDYANDFMLTNPRRMGRYIKAHEYDVAKHAHIVIYKRQGNRALYYVERPEEA